LTRVVTLVLVVFLNLVDLSFPVVLVQLHYANAFISYDKVERNSKTSSAEQKGQRFDRIFLTARAREEFNLTLSKSIALFT
jgi:hypothetical protein